MYHQPVLNHHLVINLPSVDSTVTLVVKLNLINESYNSAVSNSFKFLRKFRIMSPFRSNNSWHDQHFCSDIVKIEVHTD